MAFHTTVSGFQTTEDGHRVMLRTMNKAYPFPTFRVILDDAIMVGLVGQRGPFSWYVRPLRHGPGPWPGRVVHERWATGDYPTAMEAAKVLVTEYFAQRAARSGVL